MADKTMLAEALLGAVDVLRHCVTDGPGCDDAAARRKAIEDGEAALRAAGVKVPVPDAPLSSGYGVTVRKAQVRAMAGREPVLMDEWQVWATNRKTGRPCIHRRFSFELEARAEAISLRALRKANGVKP